MLQTSQIAAIRAVATAAPERALRQLEAALRGDDGPAALVRDLLEAELAEREARDQVLAPLLPACGPPRHPLALQLFPTGTPARLWAALKAAASEDTQLVMAGGPSEVVTPVRNRLCLRAAASLRTGEATFRPLLESLAAADAARLALTLELTPLARATAAELPQWFARTTGAHVAAMRLAYKDAERLGEGAGPLLLELLLAGLDEPWRVLQLIGWIMDRPEERFVADSELAGLVSRIIASLDGALGVAREADFARGPRAGLEAARALERGLATAAALESGLTLKRGPWADATRKQRAALAGFAETRLREAEAAVHALLPPRPLKIAGRTLGGGARYGAAPDPAVLLKARALLTFLSEIHDSAESGGFGALWARTAKAVDERLTAATDELVDMLHAGLGAADPIRASLDAAAALTDVVQGGQAAAVVRRRAAAA